MKKYKKILWVVLFLALAGLYASSALFAQGRFIDNKDGTVTDTKTNLMWAKDDNQGNITWRNAKAYCEHIILSKYEDWRMPTIDELATLYDKNSKGYESDCGTWVKLNPAIHLSCGWVWAKNNHAITASVFNFIKGYRYTDLMLHKRNFRALPVRTVKK